MFQNPKSKTLNLLLNIQIIPSPNKIQLLQKQFPDDFVKNLRKTTESKFLYFTSFLKNMYSSLASQIANIFMS